MVDLARMSERHEVRVEGEGQTIVFVADSADGRLIIRQERAGEDPAEVCSIALSNPEELRAFFTGLQRVVASLGHSIETPATPATPGRGAAPRAAQRAFPEDRAGARDSQEREALVAQARERNPQAFAPWTRDEEEEIRRRHASGESVQTIASARRRSPRAIELRLQRMGVLPPE
jgi:hypothetical protein